jgi:hypothetical protein
MPSWRSSAAPAVEMTITCVICRPPPPVVSADQPFRCDGFDQACNSSQTTQIVFSFRHIGAVSFVSLSTDA